MTHDSKRVSPFEQVVLVLQGGGALGAYQAGDAFQALDEAKVQFDWLCGVSIGAINSSLIAGNPPETRVERLREFWNAVTEPPQGASSFSWLSNLPWVPARDSRSMTKKMDAFANMVYGVPNFYAPRPMLFPGSVTEPDQISYYDTSPVKATLERLVDFDRINSKAIRLSVSATNAETGDLVYFDNTERKITVSHILASGLCRQVSRRPKLMGNIIGMVASLPTRPCNGSSIAGHDLVRFYSKWISGMPTVRCPSM